MRIRISFTLVALLALFLSATAAPPRKVMIVSTGDGERAAAFKALLHQHGMSAKIVTWEGAGVDLAKKFDLVLVTGKGRRINAGKVVRGYTVPVLGIGPYGCKYFGLLKLKHGHPYT